MSRRIKIQLDGVSGSGYLHEEAAPTTAARFWAALPIEGTLRHVRWSGDAGYILASELADESIPIEHAVSFYPPGSIAFRPEHGEIAFCYGQAQARDHMQPAGRASHLATLDRNVEALLEAVASTRRQGGKPIRIEREEAK
ncbi:MAG TPA: DUF3830 family protein [Candidatus Limnocylindrales bacterium]|nr:DUF3830 family protein [Candidatus Limnocylindrales bacterium]